MSRTMSTPMRELLLVQISVISIIITMAAAVVTEVKIARATAEEKTHISR